MLKSCSLILFMMPHNSKMSADVLKVSFKNLSQSCVAIEHNVYSRIWVVQDSFFLVSATKRQVYRPALGVWRVCVCETDKTDRFHSLPGTPGAFCSFFLIVNSREMEGKEGKERWGMSSNRGPLPGSNQRTLPHKHTHPDTQGQKLTSAKRQMWVDFLFGE